MYVYILLSKLALLKIEITFLKYPQHTLALGKDVSGWVLLAFRAPGWMGA